MFKYFISTLVFTISILAHGQQASFPSAEDIQQSWKKMQTAQQAQVTPRYGTQRAVYAKVKLNKRFFDSDLLDLNIRASSVWDTLVGCHGEQASATYFTGNPCPQAKAELKELAKNIRQYLSSAYLDSFHSYDLECNQGEGCNYLLREQKEIVSRRFSAEAVQTILELEKQLEVPLLHPLFVQIVMDITTEGFPFQFVKKICTGFFCRSAYYMLDSNALSNTAL
ncbi:MAG TPA: hypothetical protein VN132_16465, partial [Bdellovibrio sp.]|nr:hypothetical protein [Bdellovibrio sp.]